GRNSVRNRVVPSRDEIRHVLFRCEQRGAWYGLTTGESAGARKYGDGLIDHAASACVGEAAHRDESDSFIRQPAHRRPEARQTAGVPHHRAIIARLANPETITVAA